MAVNIDTLYETVADGQSPSSASFNPRLSSVVRTWFLPNPNGTESTTPGLTASDLQTLPRDIMGTTFDVVGVGALQRQLPLADGLYPYMYAADIQNMRGIGSYSREPAQLSTNDATFPGYALWTNYLITVLCTNRPYPVSPDSAITTNTVLWFDASGNQQLSTYAPEWNRFCDFDFVPEEEWLEQQRGASYFQTSAGAEPGNGQTSQQSVRMMMPDSIFTIRWEGVPLRYCLSPNSYLNKFRGRINQSAWAGPPGANQIAGTFPPGSLLYLGFKPRIYSPVYPVQTSLAGSTISYNRLCDIEMAFLHTKRVGNDLPAAPTNANYVLGGWNLLPYLPRRAFYYNYNQDLSNNKTPQFYSFPIELLFTDPDTPGGYTGNG